MYLFQTQKARGVFKTSWINRISTSIITLQSSNKKNSWSFSLAVGLKCRSVRKYTTWLWSALGIYPKGRWELTTEQMTLPLVFILHHYGNGLIVSSDETSSALFKTCFWKSFGYLQCLESLQLWEDLLRVNVMTATKINPLYQTCQAAFCSVSAQKKRLSIIFFCFFSRAKDNHSLSNHRANGFFSFLFHFC